MTTDEWKKAFDIMRNYGVGFIVLFGGEPTLRDDLPEIVKYLNEIDMPHTIITNGTILLRDEEYYWKLLKAKPYGISVSVNTLKPTTKFHDDLKSDVGHKVLLKLLKDYPECDKVANMAVTRENIELLPEIVSYFSNLGVWSILSFFHVSPQREAMYWKYRGPVDKDNRSLVFREEDEGMISRIAQWFINHYDELKLHNRKEYFEVWRKYGVKQNWHCRDWTCPAINPDGSLMACIDRELTKSFNILDLPQKEKEVYEDFKYVIKGCHGFWDHMWETGSYAAENKAELGKKRFSHQSNKDE